MLYVKDVERMKQFMAICRASNQPKIGLTYGRPSIQTVLDSPCTSFLAEIAKHIEITSPPTRREKDPVKLIFEVKDVESERVRLESLGIRILQRPWQQPGEACDAVDADDNVFQICSPGADALL